MMRSFAKNEETVEAITHVVEGMLASCKKLCAKMYAHARETGEVISPEDKKIMKQSHDGLLHLIMEIPNVVYANRGCANEDDENMALTWELCTILHDAQYHLKNLGACDSLDMYLF